MFNRKLCKILVAFAMLVLSMPAIAGQITQVSIEHVLAYGSTAIVKLGAVQPNTESCTRSDAGSYVAIEFVDGDGLYSTLLSAYMAGRSVGFGVSGCSIWGETTVPKVYRVEMFKQ